MRHSRGKLALLAAATALAVLALALADPTLAQKRPRDSKLPPPGPAPRAADGHAVLGGATKEEKGIFAPLFGISEPISPAATVPFQPWAKALYDARQKHELEPHTRCKASGTARQFQTPYGVEFVELPEQARVYIFDIGGPHTFRIVYTDGRSHPNDLEPSYYGHSIG